MMTSKNLLIILSLFFLNSSSGFTEELQTSEGVVFIKLSSNGTLGEAWLDYDEGLIWGGASLNTEDNRPPFKKMFNGTYKEAKKHCEDLKARLPTLKEYENLAISMGKDSTDNKVYKAQILQHLGKYTSYWTSTSAWFGFSRYIFNGKTGETDTRLVGSTSYARCVRESY